ncbi:MAG TPA: ATP-grasp domain-containing protein [Gemmatimonadaceae bacterium]|nr:ATP-grasp domain-containing protein [Gemmatimonadaceae bacterium]
MSTDFARAYAAHGPADVNQRTVVVTDGDERAALAVIRSLAAAGYRCVVVSSSGSSLAGASRSCARELSVPKAIDAPTEFARAVAEIVRSERASLLIPMTEAAALATLPVRASFGDCVIPMPDAESFRALSDKQHLLDVARSIGIATPAQVSIPDAATGATFDPSTLPFPVVLKPARSVGEHRGSRVKLSVVHAADAHAFRRACDALPPAAFPLLVQQRIVGPGVGVFLLRWNDTIHATFAHRRLTEKPPWGGVSVYRESIAPDPDLVARSRALIEQFDWRGVAMVEYKLDAATGRPFLMEVNGRFWGSLQLAIDAGVDFPRLLASLALGGAGQSPAAFAVGVRSRWWWGEVDHIVTRMKRRRDAQPLPPGTVSFVRAIGELLCGPFRARDYEEVFRWSDPAPFLRESLRWFGLKSP